MRWDRILRRLENKMVINQEEHSRVMDAIKITPKQSFEFKRLLMVKAKYEKQLKSVQEAIRYVKHNRSTYPLRRVERKFNISLYK